MGHLHADTCCSDMFCSPSFKFLINAPFLFFLAEIMNDAVFPEWKEFCPSVIQTPELFTLVLGLEVHRLVD